MKILILFYPIGQQNATILKGLALQQVQIDLVLHFMKKRNAGAEQHRVNVETDFVNQAGLEKCFGKIAAAHDTNVFAGLAFQAIDKISSVF